MKKFRLPTAYTILFILLVLTAAATWLIPAGRYERTAEGTPVAGTYHQVEQSPQGPGDVVLASFQGFYDAVDVALFILMVGGFLGVMMETGAIDAGVSAVVRRLGGREIWLIPVLMVLFSLGGTSFGMWEETMAFYPLLIPVFISAGYDALVGIAVVLLGSGAGVLASTVNPFATGIASGFAGTSLGEGLGLRLAMLVVFDAVAIAYVMRYAAAVRRDPGRSLTADHGLRRQGGESGAEPPALDGRRKLALALFALVFLVMVYAVIPFDEIGLPVPTLGGGFPELSGLFLVGGGIIGLCYGLGEERTAKAFVAGASELVGVALIIGISRGITVLMDGGGITDTVLYWGERALEGAGSLVFVLLVYLIYLPLSVLIPSSSGLATLSIPVLAPLGQFAGVEASLVVTAFQSASGLVNIITPTAAVVMGGLALGDVPYDRWVRFVWKLMLIFFLLTVAFLSLSALL